MNRALSIRSRKKDDHAKEAPKHTFSISTLRGIQQAELSKKLYKLIKTENHAIGAYETAGRERLSIASQLSDWGESTGDDAVSDLSDKIGVILSEIGEQEDLFAQNLEDYRAILKQIRNIEASVQPSRDQKAKIADEIQKLKYKEPSSPKIVTLEQELVRAEAQNLVAEAQLTNTTRQKLKEAFDVHFAATIERAEKQIILSRYGRRLLNLLDDTPVVPGDVRQPFDQAGEARQILADAEQELLSWQSNLEPIHSSAGSLGANLMPTEQHASANTGVNTGAETTGAGSGAGTQTHSEVTEPLAAPPPTEKPAAEAQGTHLEQATA
ncbi:Sphingolipid long chain base-responsive protein LSP1 [Exophiala dermatitidis]